VRESGECQNRLFLVAFAPDAGCSLDSASFPSAGTASLPDRRRRISGGKMIRMPQRVEDRDRNRL